MGKIEMFRKALALPEVVQNVELTGMLKELYTDHLELLEKNNAIKEQLKSLEDIVDIKKNAKKRNGFYNLDDEMYADGRSISFCLNCLYEHKLQIPMAFGVIENGLQDVLSGEVFRPTTYGLICKKCNTKITAVNNSEGEKEWWIN